MKKITAAKEDCLSFYCQGWRYGEIVKRYAKDRVTVKDCTGRRYRVQLNDKGQWVAMNNGEFKGSHNLKEKKNGKKKKIRKIKRKKRIKIKTKKRKLRFRKSNS